MNLTKLTLYAFGCQLGMIASVLISFYTNEPKFVLLTIMFGFGFLLTVYKDVEK